MNLLRKYLCQSVFAIPFQVSQDFAVRQRELKVNNNINREQGKVCIERGGFFTILFAIYYWQKPKQMYRYTDSL